VSKNIETALNQLVDALAGHKSVRAIGLSGGERPFPEPGEGDIDLFVYCTEILPKDQRGVTLMSLPEGFERVEIGKMESGHWGQGDGHQSSFESPW
jgi:hypothetical protein